MAAAILPKCVPYLNNRCLPYLQTKAQLERVSVDQYLHLKASQFHLLPEEHWPLINREQLEFYANEEGISPEAEKFIQQIDLQQLSLLDPRLASYYSAEQVSDIDKPQFVKYLNVEQLVFLNPALASYLSSKQIKLLDQRHEALIKTIDDVDVLKRLSKAAISLLSLEQVLLMGDERICRRLSYFNPDVLRAIKGTVIAKADKMPIETFKQLTSRQVQCYLSERRKIASYLSEMTAEQWQGMDPLFQQSFFADKPKKVLKFVPRNRIAFLTKEALFKWCGVERPSQCVKDLIKGFCSLLFYPLILMSGFFLTLFSRQNSRERNKILRPLFLAPLLLLSRETYYRNIMT
jgi:hypothetical protein